MPAQYLQHLSPVLRLVHHPPWNANARSLTREQNLLAHLVELLITRLLFVRRLTVLKGVTFQAVKDILNVKDWLHTFSGLCIEQECRRPIVDWTDRSWNRTELNRLNLKPTRIISFNRFKPMVEAITEVVRSIVASPGSHQNFRLNRWDSLKENVIIKLWILDGWCIESRGRAAIYRQ